LDVGTRKGWIVDAFVKDGAAVTGIDPELMPERAEVKGVDLIEATLEKLEPTQPYELVVVKLV